MRSLYYVRVPMCTARKKEEVDEWLNEKPHRKQSYLHHFVDRDDLGNFTVKVFCFNNPDIAMLFKLTWGGA